MEQRAAFAIGAELDALKLVALRSLDYSTGNSIPSACFA
jgi:hypothetical protein